MTASMKDEPSFPNIFNLLKALIRPFLFNHIGTKSAWHVLPRTTRQPPLRRGHSRCRLRLSMILLILQLQNDSSVRKEHFSIGHSSFSSKRSTSQSTLRWTPV